MAETAAGPVYVPLTVPDDRVRARLRGNRAESFDLLEPGPARASPPCPHFGVCGGCTLQHVEREAYLAFKRDLVVSALAARGLGDVPVRDCLPVPAATRRRATFQAARAKGNTVLGFSERRSHRVTAIETCDVLVPELVEALPALRELAEIAGPGGYHVTATETGLDVNLLFEPEGPNPLAIPSWANRHDAARVSALGEVLIQRRVPVVRPAGVAVEPPPGAFLQPSKEGEAALAKLVLEAVGEAAPVADLHAGLGAFTFALARNAPVHAVEAGAAALAALAQGARHASGLKPVTTERRDLEHAPLTVKELKRFGAVVFDPPRAGALPQARMLAASAVPRVVAVSCNPATFARDAAALVEGGYRLHHVSPVDQFVWSAHVELV
ncbi:MAG: class I SAM-dependent RNA methyltransferase, partial [Alphaproteobacteria bacterium]